MPQRLVTLSIVQMRWLLLLNLAAAALHLGIAVAVGVHGDVNLRPPLLGMDTLFAGNTSTTTLKSFGSFPITAIVLTYPAITAAFHLCNVLVWPRYYFTCLERCENPMRWLEYSITASLMTTVISYLTGVRSSLLLASLAVLVSSTMSCGYAAEQLNRPKSATEWEDPSYLSRIRSTLTGFVPYAAEWTITLATLQHLTNCRNRVVIAVVAAELPLWTCFAVVQMVQLSLPPRRFVYGEFAYMALSLSAKAVLALVTLAAGYLDTEATFCAA